MLLCHVLSFVCVFVHTIFWVICKTRINFGTTVDITKAHLSQQNFVHILGVLVAPISVITDSSERWATDDAYVKVNCDATSFIGDVGWIARYAIVLLFRSKNLNILCVKRSKNETAICLARSLFHNQIVVDSSGVCPGWVPMSDFY